VVWSGAEAFVGEADVTLVGPASSGDEEDPFEGLTFG